MTRPDPPYLRIVGEIRRRIVSGELRPGDRVPSTRHITREWGVAMATATKVLATLSQEGLVTTVPRTGTVVATPAAPPEERRPARRTDRELGRDRIVRAAISIADTQEFTALSMRAVAAELGVATMSLYRHVRTKAELAELMTDAAFGEIDFPPDPPAGWRERLEVGARQQWGVYRRHPWLVSLLSLTRPQAQPNLLAYGEWAIRALDGLGLDPPTMFYMHFTLVSYVRGTAVNLQSEAEAEQDTGQSIEEWFSAQGPVFEAALASGSFPAFTDVKGRAGEFGLDLDQIFEFGLQRLLDGFGAVIDGTAGSPAPGPPRPS
ncbi:TetR/AcrR family transcriptional regulator C-terminal domain-containing protein [Streptosporangium soli]|nr:TetR/AcrR family transcriptional regulator C-terminal domain-containing protein [Streptosporangium sp. KLBMP 9127]